MSTETETARISAEAIKGGVADLTKAATEIGERIGAKGKELAGFLSEGAQGIAGELRKVKDAGAVKSLEGLVMQNPKTAIGVALIGGAVAAKLLSGGSQERSA